MSCACETGALTAASGGRLQPGHDSGDDHDERDERRLGREAGAHDCCQLRDRCQLMAEP